MGGTSEFVAGKQDRRQGLACQQGGKRFATHDLLQTTSACSYALRKFMIFIVESPPPVLSTRWQHWWQNEDDSNRFGITSGTDFVVYLDANANHWLCEPLIIGQQDRQTPILNDRDAARDAGLCSYAKRCVLLKSVGSDAGRKVTPSQKEQAFVLRHDDQQVLPFLH